MTCKDIVFFTGIQRFCKALKEKGYRIAVLKEEGEPLRPDHGCDFVIPYDSDDLPELEGRIRLWPERDRVLAVMNRRERRVREHALLLRAFGIDGIGEETALWTTDKYFLRRRLSEMDSTLVPPFQRIDLDGDSSDPLRIPFPVLLKPRNLFKSQLIHACRHEEELKGVLREIRRRLDATCLRHGATVERSLVAESYIVGKEASLDPLVDGWGRVYHSPPVETVPAREIGMDDHHVFARLLPSGFDPEEQEALRNAAERAVSALGIRGSAAHLDLVLGNERAWVLDVGTRAGGYRSEMMELAYGFSLDEGSFQVAIGNAPDLSNRFNRAVAVLEFFPEGEGRLERIEGLEEVRGLPSFYRLRERIPKGEEVGLARQGYRCPLFVVLTHPSKDAVRRDMERCLKRIRIRVR